MGVATGGVWTGNLRALRHILTVRCAVEAEEEIAEVCGLMLTALRDREPHIFGDFAYIDGAWPPVYRKV
jgi:thymidylate synthase ThyX